jgi:hypothetical protein
MQHDLIAYVQPKTAAAKTLTRADLQTHHIAVKILQLQHRLVRRAQINVINLGDRHAVI